MSPDKPFCAPGEARSYKSDRKPPQAYVAARNHHFSPIFMAEARNIPAPRVL